MSEITKYHIELNRLDASGNLFILYPKNTLKDVYTSSTSGVTIEGKVNFFGTCDTAADTAEKTVEIDGFSLIAGAHLTVVFTNGIDVNDATLNINEAGAKAIYFEGAALKANAVRAKARVHMVYDGSYFHVLNCTSNAAYSKNANTKKFYLLGTPTNVDGSLITEYYDTGIYVSDVEGQLVANTIMANTFYLGDTSASINSTNYTGKAATVGTISEYLVDSCMSGNAQGVVTKALTANQGFLLQNQINTLRLNLNDKATKYTSIGSSTQPVYIDSNGVPTAISYTIAKSVPSNAVFTDTNTTYSAGTGLSLSGTTFSVNYGSSSGTACQGNDSRLSNARPASDVYSWAKASSKPSYSWSEITRKPSTFTPASHSHSYAGSSSAGGSATSAISVVDYGDASKTIQIGFSGAGASTSNLGYIAGYLSGGTQIKDVSKDVLKSWLGLGSNAYNSTSYLPLSGGTVNGNIAMNGGIYFNHGWLDLYYGGTNRLSIYTNVGDGSSHLRNNLNGPMRLHGNQLEVGNKDWNAWTPVYAGGFVNNSSRLCKDNIKDITDDEAKKILDARVVSFDYKETFGGKKNLRGVIAEEIMDIIPSVVEIPDGYNEDDFDESKGISNKTLSVDYSRFVPYLIKMVQLQQKEIDEIKINK